MKVKRSDLEWAVDGNGEVYAALRAALEIADAYVYYLKYPGDMSLKRVDAAVAKFYSLVEDDRDA